MQDVFVLNSFEKLNSFLETVEYNWDFKINKKNESERKRNLTQKTSQECFYAFGSKIVYIPCKPGELITFQYPIQTMGIVTNGIICCPKISASMVYADEIITDTLDVSCVYAKTALQAHSILANDVYVGEGGISAQHIRCADSSFFFQIISQGPVLCKDIVYRSKPSLLYANDFIRADSVCLKEVACRGDVVIPLVRVRDLSALGNFCFNEGSIRTLSYSKSLKGVHTLGEVRVQHTVENIKESYLPDMEKKRLHILQTCKSLVARPEQLWERLTDDAQMGTTCFMHTTSHL